MKILCSSFTAIPLKLIIKFASVQRRKKPKKPMENVSFTWSTAVSVLEPASPWGNCELPSWRVLGVEVSVLKNMNMQTKTKTMPIIKAVMMIALPSHVDPANFYGGFMVHQALASWWLILCRLGYGIPRYYLVKHSFWACLWWCFQEKLALNQ